MFSQQPEIKVKAELIDTLWNVNFLFGFCRILNELN